ncbi:MAG: PIN domain-containing protein [Thiomargarita sp.]|nr:PIN domain-containing protein [Thiomargarita sp.]
MKKILFDTSTLVAASIISHPKHSLVLPYLQEVKKGINKGVVSTHSLAEIYNILTIFPANPRRISPQEAQQLIQQNIVDVFEVITLSELEYMSVIKHLSESNIIGGVIYDALILKAAIKANVDYVITLNEKDFKRVYPDFADKIISP